MFFKKKEKNIRFQLTEKEVCELKKLIKAERDKYFFEVFNLLLSDEPIKIEQAGFLTQTYSIKKCKFHPYVYLNEKPVVTIRDYTFDEKDSKFLWELCYNKWLVQEEK